MADMSATKRQKPAWAVASAFAGGIRAEMVHARDDHRTAFAIWKNGLWYQSDRFVDSAGRTMQPYPADHPLIANNVVLFPDEPVAYSSRMQLIDEVRQYIHRYVDVSDSFELIASYYVLLTWFYDCFNELPYLRLKGDFGTGKTRFLQVVGAICYRPIFASGASTVAPLFHMLDLFRGTLILDEADFRYSDEKAELTKIFNNGNMRGAPVLRARMNSKREFDPHVFQVFGPKVMAMRGEFEDAALESRFITHETHPAPIRPDLPISLPDTFAAESAQLRNKLLMFRFEYWRKLSAPSDLPIASLPPRTLQMLLPILTLADDARERTLLLEILQRHHTD
ncbi:MAG: hypothetical protein AAGD43_07520 [Pseudomonadota bacterium]